MKQQEERKQELCQLKNPVPQNRVTSDSPGILWESPFLFWLGEGSLLMLSANARFNTQLALFQEYQNTGFPNFIMHSASSGRVFVLLFLPSYDKN